MDKTSGTSERLAITSATPPRKISRPDRYEVVDTPLSPPGSNYLLFDSSSLFSSHPHKYRLLVKKTSEDDLTPGPSSENRNGHKPLGHRRSRSLVSLPALDKSALIPDNTGGLSDLTKDNDRDQHALEQFLSSKPLSRRRSSDSFVPDISANLQEPYLLPYDQHSHKKGLVPEKLSRSVDNVAGLKEDNPVSFQIEPFKEFDNSMSSGGATATSDEKPRPPVVAPSPGGSPSPEGAIPKYLVKEVQPEPRRLFGFGPLYRPLPEVVVEKQHPLTERVKREGITAVGTDTLDAPSAHHRKTSTGKETSMWMPFSF